MKRIVILLLMISMFLCGCSPSDDKKEPDVANLPAASLMAVSYGDDPEQLMDVYLPANRTSDTKVVVLVHGGGWSEGSRTDFTYAVALVQSQFPDYAVVNIDYRLGSVDSPGFPKQVEDIGKVLDFLEHSDYQISATYAFIGASAGAHLSMLYSYNYDTGHKVKAVCSIVGPTDFTDPAYLENELYSFLIVNLVGNVSFGSDPGLYADVSPITHVSASSPATIQFNGGQDPLIPVTQASRLYEKLDGFGVYNEHYLYPEGGHGDWDLATTLDMQAKLLAFLQNKF